MIKSVSNNADVDKRRLIHQGPKSFVDGRITITWKEFLSSQCGEMKCGETHFSEYTESHSLCSGALKCFFFLLQACHWGSSFFLLPTTPGISGSRTGAPARGERGEIAADRARGEEQAQVKRGWFCNWPQIEHYITMKG